nr:hypothetical protein [uncultured Caproiciproducens sp.]
MRKPTRLLLFLSVLLVALTACASKTKAPNAIMSAKTAPAESNARSSVIQKLYTNDKLSFSFAVPDSWENGNYTPVTTSKTLSDDGTKYTKVDFVFQDDKDSPLLTILLVSKDWWEKTKGEAFDPKPTYLGAKGDIVYCFILPKDCPYDVGTKADLYNSMVLPDRDVPNRFKILGTASLSAGISTVEGTLVEIMTQTMTIKTDDGLSLTFLKEGVDNVNDGNGFQIECKLRIYYEGAINGVNTSAATITKVERLN